MSKYRIALATLLFVAAPVAAANAQGFLFGLAAGGMLFGGSNQYGGGGASILYSADDGILKKTDPLTMKLIASETCFNSKYGGDATKVTLGELFSSMMKNYGQKERTILQIARVFSPSTPQCAAIWFAYTEK